MPGRPWDIGMRENWLSAMAAEGLQLQSVDKYRAWFTAVEPADIRYRIDVPGEFFSAERSLKLLQSGWTLAAEHGCFDYYSSPVAENAPEIVADAETAVALLNKQMKFQAIKAALSIAAIPLAFLIMYLFFGLDNSMVYSLVCAQSWVLGYFGWVLIPLVILAYHFFYDYLSIKKIRAMYREDGGIDRTEPWVMKKSIGRRLIKLARNFAYFLIGVYLIIPGSLVAGNAEPYDINNAPVVYLDSLEKDAVRVPDTEESQNGKTGVYDYFNWTPLAPFQLHTYDSGEFQKGESRHKSSMNTDSYQIRFAWLSGKILSDLTAPSRYTESDVVEIEHPGLDKLFIRKEDGRIEVYAAKNKSVIRLNYSGPAEDEAIIDAVVQTIDVLASYRLENKTNEKFGWLWRFYN
jgi:hypothetical protein